MKNQNMKIKAFTLVELLIVISLIWLIFGIGLNISNKPIEDIKNIHARDQFVDAYNDVITTNLNSKRYNQSTYSNIQIQIYSGTVSANIFYNLENWNTWTDEIKLENYVLGSDLDYLIVLKPYDIGCEIYANGNTENKLTWANFQIYSDRWYEYKFQISDSDCKIINKKS